MLKPISKSKEMFANRMLVSVPALISINIEVGSKVNIGINFLYEVSPATEAIPEVPEIKQAMDENGRITQGYVPAQPEIPAKAAVYGMGDPMVSYHITPNISGKEKEGFTLLMAHSLVADALKAEAESGREVDFEIVNMKTV